MATNIDTITVNGIRIKEDTDWVMEITVVDDAGTPIDWTTYSIESGVAGEAGETPYMNTFVTGDASGVLYFTIPESVIDIAINTQGRKRSIMMVTADKSGVKSRIFEAEIVFSPGKTV